jgi:hypothetical protein
MRLPCRFTCYAAAPQFMERGNSMILLGKESKQSTTQVLERAVRYFGPDGLGLDVGHWDAASVLLQGGGGYVTVRANPRRDQGLTSVEIESREWERDAERFLTEI